MILGHLSSIDPVILFFFLGMLASWMRSDLEIPQATAKFLSIFLLTSLGLKGGHEVRMAQDLGQLGPILLIGIFSCLAIPAYMYFWLRRSLGAANAAALAAAYGSVSAVTFIAAKGFLNNEQIPFSGFMVAVMALMEIPAIVLAISLYRRERGRALTDESASEVHRGSIWSAKSVVLLLGGFVIGFLMNEPAWESVRPVVKDAFKGVLAFFLLDLGISAQRQLANAWKYKWSAILIGCLTPAIHGCLTLLVARIFGVSLGDQVLLAVLAGSASYIAAPAAIRGSISEANPSLYVALPLALTFPVNVLVWIPVYIGLAQWLAS